MTGVIDLTYMANSTTDVERSAFIKDLCENGLTTTLRWKEPRKFYDADFNYSVVRITCSSTVKECLGLQRAFRMDAALTPIDDKELLLWEFLRGKL